MLIRDKIRLSHRNGESHLNIAIFQFQVLFLFALSFSSLEGLKFVGRKVVRHPPQPLVGITLQEQQGPLFYDTFFPVIYEMEIPTWGAADLHLEIPKNLGGAYSGPSADDKEKLCNNTAAQYIAGLNQSIPVSPDLWEITLCPIKRKFDDLLETFAREMKVFETFNASITKLDSHFSSCHEIKPHFSNHIIDELEIELYLVQIILDCPVADIIHHKLNVSLPDKGKYSELLQKFLDTYILPRFRLIGFPKFAIPTNTLMTVHTTHLLHYLLDTFQWTTSINTCNAQRIPRLLISQDILRSTLEEVQDKAKKDNLTLTIPISDLSNYYKYKLADCVTTTANKYVVRILVPLTKAAARYRQVLIKSIPFLSRDTSSSKTMICHHKTVEGNYIVEGSISSIKPVDMMPNTEDVEMFRVPPEGDRNIFNRCLQSTLINDSTKMLENCRMTCVTFDAESLPYIKRIRSDQFVIAGRSTEKISIICKKEEDKPVPVEDIPADVGSLLITIPCGCYMTHKNIKYEINGPCEFTLDFMPIHPKGFSYDSLLEHYFHHHLQNISKSILSSMVSQNQLKINQSQAQSSNALFDDDDNKEQSEAFTDNNVMIHCTTWPIYLAYVFLFVGGLGFVFAFYVVRNVYIRIGQLEMSTGLTEARVTSTGNGVCLQRPIFSRNIPVAFNVRGTGASGDPVY